MLFIHHPTLANAHTPRAVTIGNFDGVHIGHAAILDELVAHANAHGLTPTVVTFAPNPKAFFAKQRGKPEPKRILPLRDKINLFAQHGIEQVVILPFNQALANMPAHEFVEHILCACLNTQHLRVGDDFKFGAGRTGDFELLRDLSDRHHYSLTAHHSIVHHSEHSAERVSSTAIRTALHHGEPHTAAALLGHPYTLSGHVIYGQQLGRTIGIPTINLKMPEQLAAQGVYAVTITLNGKTHQGVASIGTRPSVKTNGQCWLEVFVFNFNESVYGDIACVSLQHKIRDEEKFDDITTLLAAINQDIDQARRYFSSAN